MNKKIKSLALSLLLAISITTVGQALPAKAIVDKVSLSLSSTINKQATLPTKFDSRKHGYVTSIKNQGNTNTCWAHGAIGAVETSILKRYKKNTDLSENHMALNSFPFVNLQSGGSDIAAAKYLTTGRGPVYETESPLGDLNQKPNLIPRYVAKDMPLITNEVGSTRIRKIKEFVKNYGAVTTGCAVQQNDKDIFFGSKTVFNWKSAELTNHEMLIVGWDDNYAVSNFKEQKVKPKRPGAFICKNSWGTNVGDKGYYYMSYEDLSLLNVEDTMMAIAEVESGSSINSIYAGCTNTDINSSIYSYTSELNYIPTTFNKFGTNEAIDSVGAYITAGNAGPAALFYVEDAQFLQTPYGPYIDLNEALPRATLIKEFTFDGSKGYRNIKLNKSIIPKNKKNFNFILVTSNVVGKGAYNNTNITETKIIDIPSVIKKDNSITSNNIASSNKKIGVSNIPIENDLTSGRIYTKSTYYPKITSFKTNTSSPRPVKSTIRLTATAETGCLYKFSIKDSNGKTITIQNYSSKNYADWKPTVDGKYTLTVNVKKGSSRVSSKSLTFTIYGKSTISALKTDKKSNMTLGNTVKISASASKNSYYKFTVKDTSGKWKVIKNYSSTNYVKYKPSKSGSYYFKVEVRNKYSPSSTANASKTIKFTVVPKSKIYYLKTSKKSGVKANTKIKIYAKASSSSYYSFYVKKAGGGYKSIQKMGSKSYTYWKPTKKGTYYILLRVKNKKASESYQTSKTIKFIVK